MKNFSISISIMVTLGCGTDSSNRSTELTHEYFKSEVSMFGYLAELKLLSSGTFEITSVDYYSGTGGIHKGTYTWNDQLLTLKYNESENEYFYLDSNKVFRIEALDSLVADNEQHNQGYNIIELSIESGLTPYPKPARTNWEQWNKGRIKNYDKLVQAFRATLRTSSRKGENALCLLSIAPGMSASAHVSPEFWFVLLGRISRKC